MDWDALSETEHINLEFYLNSTLEQEYAGNTASLSAKFFDDGEEFDGDDVLFPQGYKGIVDGLAKGVDIRLSQRVEAIAYDQNGVTVTTNQGAFSVQRVMVTLPLGVLKKGEVQFTPALPPEKVAAIASLGMGVFNKCFLTFPTAFWPIRLAGVSVGPQGMVDRMGQLGSSPQASRPVGFQCRHGGARNRSVFG